MDKRRASQKVEISKILKNLEPNIVIWAMINSKLLEGAEGYFFNKISTRGLFTDGIILSLAGFSSIR